MPRAQPPRLSRPVWFSTTPRVDPSKAASPFVDPRIVRKVRTHGWPATVTSLHSLIGPDSEQAFDDVKAAVYQRPASRRRRFF